MIIACSWKDKKTNFTTWQDFLVLVISIYVKEELEVLFVVIFIMVVPTEICCLVGILEDVLSLCSLICFTLKLIKKQKIFCQKMWVQDFRWRKGLHTCPLKWIRGHVSISLPSRNCTRAELWLTVWVRRDRARCIQCLHTCYSTETDGRNTLPRVMRHCFLPAN